MAGRNALSKSGFRPYQKGADHHPRPPTQPEQRHVTYRVQPDGNTYREMIDDQYDRKYEQVNLPHNRDIGNSSKPQNRDLRGTRPVHMKYPEPIKLPSQKPVTYRVQSDGKTYRDHSDEDPYDRKYDQASRHHSDEDPYDRKYDQASRQRNRDPAKPHVQNIRGTRVTHVQPPEPSEIPQQRPVTYRVLPDGKTFREQHGDNQLGRTYEEPKPVSNIRGTRVMHEQHPEPSKLQSKEDPMDATVRAIMQNSGKGKGKIHRWTMFRLWVNREISQEVRKDNESKKRLDLPMDSMVTSVLVDPASDTNGKRLQKEYGAEAHGAEHFNILPENMYFVFGIPRAKASTDASVSEFLETMSNAVARSEQDVLSTKDEISTRDDPTYRETRGLAPEVNQRGLPTKYDKHLKGEANDDEKYRRWQASNLKKSRYKHDNEIKQNGKDWEDDRVKSPSQWEAEFLGKTRKHSPKPSETDDWNVRQWDDSGLGKSRNRGTDDIRKSHAEEITDFGKYHFDSYEMPNKKWKDNLSNTRTTGENTYATHVNK